MYLRGTSAWLPYFSTLSDPIIIESIGKCEKKLKTNFSKTRLKNLVFGGKGYLDH